MLSMDARRHVYESIQTALDPHTSSSVGTPLDQDIKHSKKDLQDCPRTVDTKLKTEILQAHDKLIHLAVWARPNLAHSKSIHGRYIHSQSLKHWGAYLRLAKYLVRTMEFSTIASGQPSAITLP